MDAKQACDKLNGFNFQNRYLVGEFTSKLLVSSRAQLVVQCSITSQRRWPSPARTSQNARRTWKSLRNSTESNDLTHELARGGQPTMETGGDWRLLE